MLRWLNSYPPRYRVAFASSRVPYPPPHRLALRLTFPRGRETGLPRSARVPVDELGSTCSPVARHLRETIRARLHLATSLSWAKPFSPFGLLVLKTFISSSLPLAMSSRPSSRPPWGSQSCTPSPEAHTT